MITKTDKMDLVQFNACLFRDMFSFSDSSQKGFHQRFFGHDADFAAVTYEFLGFGFWFRADAQIGWPLSSCSTRSPLDFLGNQASGSPARRPIFYPCDVLNIHEFHRG